MKSVNLNEEKNESGREGSSQSQSHDDVFSQHAYFEQVYMNKRVDGGCYKYVKKLCKFNTSISLKNLYSKRMLIFHKFLKLKKNIKEIGFKF